MLIQLIIFLTKNKIFASEINSSGKAETISIKGNTEIKCEGKESIDELIDCLYDAFNIDDFADDNFDIVIVESGADKEVIKHLDAKCSGASKLNIISMEKLLPVIASNKNMVKADEEIIVTFADMFFKIACGDNKEVKVGKARKNEEAIKLTINDFTLLYKYIVGNLGTGVDEKALTEKQDTIIFLEEEIKTLNLELQNREAQFKNSQNTLNVRENELTKLKQKFAELQKELEKAKGPSDSEVFKKRLEIIKNYENEIVVNTYGSFYTKGNIPKKRLDEVLSIIDNNKINREHVIAIYCGTNRRAATNILLFTDEELYFDKGFTYMLDTDGIKSSFAYENILRLERTEKSYWVESIPLNAVTVHLPNDQVITIGNNEDREIGYGTFAACDWGLDAEIFLNLLKELSTVSETE